MNKLTEQLAAVEADISAARAVVEKHRATWRHQCQQGLFGAASILEDEIVATERRILRYTVRREYLQIELKTAPQPEPA